MPKRFMQISICFFFITVAIFVLPTGSSYASDPDEKHILILSPYTPDYPASVASMNGLKSTFQNYTQYKFSYSYEYFNLSRFQGDDEYLESTAGYLDTKYSKHRPDLIVVDLGALTGFLDKYNQKIFPGIPVIFLQSGIRTNSEKGSSPTNPGELFSDIIEKNIILILQTRPIAKKIYVVIAESANERNILQSISRTTDQYADKVKFLYLNKKTYPQMMNEIKNASNDSAILYIQWVTDVDGKIFLPIQVLQEICKVATVPVYSVASHYLGAGTVGGYGLSWEKAGQHAAELGVEMLNGRNKTELSSAFFLNNEYVFDWRQLKRWGIDEKRLPPGSRVLYKELTVWEQYRVYIVSSALLIVILSLLVVALLINRSRRLRAEKDLVQLNAELENKVLERTMSLSKTNVELKYSQERYRALMDQSFEGLSLIDIQTREVVEVNLRFTEMFGYSLPEDAPLYVDKFGVDSQRNIEKIYDIMLKQQQFLPPEPRIFRHKNGVEVSVERAATVITINDKKYLLNSMRDMTAERRRQAEIDRDVKFASQMQRKLLSNLSDSSFITIRTIYHPASAVSGDSYFMEWLNDDGKLLRGFLIDVTGHGLATALQTASINALLRETSITNLTITEQLRRIDERAAKYFSDGSFAAMMGFEIDLINWELRYAAAGITEFYVNGSEIVTPGMFVGMLDNAEFGTGAISISEGDCIHFLTDGFTDRLNQPENANFWSTDGKDFDADVAALEQLAENGNLRDDATGLCFKINGEKQLLL